MQPENYMGAAAPRPVAKKPVQRYMSLAPNPKPAPGGGIMAKKINIPMLGAVPLVAVLGIVGVLIWKRKAIMAAYKR